MAQGPDRVFSQDTIVVYDSSNAVLNVLSENVIIFFEKQKIKKVMAI